VNESLSEQWENEHMEDLLSILVLKGIGKNVIEILNKIESKFSLKYGMLFDRKYLMHKNIICHRL
jgi:hypothetical protein